jgi:hypothetical protein
VKEFAGMKKSGAIIAAEFAVSATVQELTQARAEVTRLEDLHKKALSQLWEAQKAADSLLPQCRIVSYRRRSGVTEDLHKAVIIKKTPSGMLVVRRFGEDGEARYKWSESSRLFTQTERQTRYAYSVRQLRDVPVEFLPAPQPD